MTQAPQAPPDPTIRPLTDADIESAISLWTECGLVQPWNDPKADIERARTSGEAIILVADDPHKGIAATILAGNDGHRGWLYYLAVSPGLQSTGLGRRMVRAAEDWLKARGVVKVMLMIRPSNLKVRGFYETLGYEDQDRVLMARWLDGQPMNPDKNSARNIANDTGTAMGLAEERQRRILTTHVGSLPRPDALSELMAEGDTQGPAYTKMVHEAVASVVKRQTDCGIDIVDDGEQSKPGFISYIDERLGGMAVRTDNPPQIDTREKRSFPEFYCNGHSGTRPPPRLCTGAVTYTGHEKVKTDIANLKAALKGADVTDAFMPAVSPGQIFRYHVNKFYKSDDEFLLAIGEAMREEYSAIIGAGFMLQIDDPHLAMHYMLEPDLSIADTRRWAEHYVEILNHALRDLPVDRIRHHTCYGINMGPRTHDIEFKHLIDIVLKIRAGFYSFEAANPRHEHEWKLWEDVKLPAGKAILPGVITHASVLVEHPELVSERIQRFARAVGRENVIAGADCGFASTPRAVPEVHPSIVWAKFQSLSEGARLASRVLWA